MTANWIMVAVGIFSMISPWALGFSSISTAKWESLITGLIVLLLNVWIIFGSAEVKEGDTVSEKGRSK